MEWKVIEGTGGKFSVSSCGVVYNNVRGVEVPQSVNGGYKVVGLWYNSKNHLECVHRLVAKHFVTKEDSRCFYVKHINGDRLDNNYKNLLWEQSLYLGEGRNNPRKGESWYGHKVASVWSGMIRRCYDKAHPDYSNYGGSGVVVSEEWKDFNNFVQWYIPIYEKYSEEGGVRIELDKDLLYEDNKIYSDKTCLLIPVGLNQLFRRNSLRNDSNKAKLQEYLSKYKNIFPENLKARLEEEIGKCN